MHAYHVWMFQSFVDKDVDFVIYMQISNLINFMVCYKFVKLSFNYDSPLNKLIDDLKMTHFSNYFNKITE